MTQNHQVWPSILSYTASTDSGHVQPIKVFNRIQFSISILFETSPRVNRLSDDFPNILERMIKWLVHSFHPLHLKIHSEFVCTTGTIINGLLRNLMIPFQCLVFFGFTENYKAVLLALKWSVFAENLRPALFSDSCNISQPYFMG